MFVCADCMCEEGGQAALLRGRKAPYYKPQQQRCRFRSLPLSLAKMFEFPSLCALRPVLVPCAPNLAPIPLNTAALLLLPDSFLTRPPDPPPAHLPLPTLRALSHVPLNPMDL
jgi:hypothetical protein